MPAKLVGMVVPNDNKQAMVGLADTVLAETTGLADNLSEKRPF